MKFSKSQIASISALVLLFPTLTFASATFYRNLSLGYRGLDVLDLQKILNSDPLTQISSTGAGSPGYESQYFGSLTKNAVIKFQNKYKSEILTPAGLSYGTGYVGSMTLSKLNRIDSSQQGQISSNIDTETTETIVAPKIESTDLLSKYRATGIDRINIYATDDKLLNVVKELSNRINTAVLGNDKNPNFNDLVNIPLTNFSQVTIKQISVITAKVGSNITIGGNGFLSSNTVYFGPDYLLKDPSISGSTISLTIPPIPLGKYDVVVKNANGVSNSNVLIITKDGVSHVTVEKDASPASVSYGGTVTIFGTGFTGTANDVMTSFGILKNISSSDGTSLSIEVSPEFLRETVKQKTFDQDYPIEFRVINSNGVSNIGGFKLRY